VVKSSLCVTVVCVWKYYGFEFFVVSEIVDGRIRTTVRCRNIKTFVVKLCDDASQLWGEINIVALTGCLVNDGAGRY
jgi:hypothetical protein